MSYLFVCSDPDSLQLSNRVPSFLGLNNDGAAQSECVGSTKLCRSRSSTFFLMAFLFTKLMLRYICLNGTASFFNFFDKFGRKIPNDLSFAKNFFWFVQIDLIFCHFLTREAH